MKKYLETHYLFLYTGLLMLVCGLLFFRSTIDIPIHDTYFIIPQVYIAIALCGVFLMFALFYFLFKRSGKSLNSILGLLHYVFTIIPIIGIPLIRPVQTRYIASESFSEEMQHAEKFNILFAIILLLFILGQLLFLINCIVALFRKRNYK